MERASTLRLRLRPTSRARAATARRPVRAVQVGAWAASLAAVLAFRPAAADGPDAGARPASAARPGKQPVKADRVLVPAGPFVRGSTRALDERPVETRKLGAFRIDRTEVTRAMYARCVAAGRCADPGVNLAVDPELPVTGVSFFDARAYCTFAGGRLPSEDEWEKAARGTDGREFPWGAEASCARGNWGNFDGEGPCRAENPGRPVPVGSYPTGASPYGVQDLAGNVWEWVTGRYDDEPGRRIVRGGSCCSYFVEPRAANRNAWAPEYKDSDLGFRCVARA